MAGPLVIAEGMRDANMYDVVRVSNQRLIGEIIEMHGDQASIQVYEETSGLGPGEPVESTEMPLSVELGPGLISSIYDGIQRPLDDIMKATNSNNLKRGVEVASLKRDKKWNFVPVAKPGDEVAGGDVLGTVQETVLVQQKIMVPPNMKGKVKDIKAGEFTVDDVVVILETEDGDKELTMAQKWPEKTSSEGSAGDWTESSRYHVPHRQRWCGCGSRTFRKRQDGDSASAGKMGGG